MQGTHFMNADMTGVCFDAVTFDNTCIKNAVGLKKKDRDRAEESVRIAEEKLK